MSREQAKQSTELSPRTALLATGIFVLTTAGVIALVVHVLSGPSTDTVKSASPRAAAPAHQADAHARTTVTSALLPDGQDYAIIVKRNLFHPLGQAVAPPAPTPPAVKKDPMPAPVVIKPFVPPAAPPAIAAPTVAFTGVVDIAGTKYALLENLADHRAQYTRLGNVAFGYTLTDIAAHSVTLEMDGASNVLTLGANKVSEKTTAPATTAPANATAPGGSAADGTNSPGGMRPGGFPSGGNIPGGYRNRGRRQQGQQPGEG